MFKNDSSTEKYRYLPPFYNTDVYGLSIVTHYRLLNSKYRTLNPEEANMFYIPYYSAAFNMKEVKQHQFIDQQFNNTDEVMWELITR